MIKNDTSGNRLERIPAECVVFNIGKAYRNLLKPFEKAFSSIGLSTMQYGLLVHIAIHEPATGRDISLVTGHDPSTLSRTLTSLEAKGWISAGRDAGGDRRKRIYTVTVEGRTMLDKAVPVWEDIHAGILRQIDQQRWFEALELIAGLQSLNIEQAARQE